MTFASPSSTPSPTPPTGDVPNPSERKQAETTSAAAPSPPPAGGLVLGINERYRAAIELAAQRTGLDSAAIAATISAEAGHLGNKAKTKMADEALSALHPDRDFATHPLDTKDPKDAGMIAEWKALYADSAWDPNSQNSETGAGGLTQFLASTWRSEATRSGTYLNEIAVQKGYVQNGKIVAGMEGELLKLRYDPTVSIVAAAEYDKLVFDRLSQETVKHASDADAVLSANHPDRDFAKHPLSTKDPKDADLIREWKEIHAGLPGTPIIPAGLTDDQKARYIYLGHHDGEEGARQILTGSLSDSRAQRLLEANVPDENKRNALVSAHGGSESKAYTAHIWGYIDDHIVPGNFRK